LEQVKAQEESIKVEEARRAQEGTDEQKLKAND